MKLLIDGNSLACRCRWAGVKDLATADGRPSGLVFGMVRGVQHVMGKEKVLPCDTTVVWDGGHAKGRKELFPHYKAVKRRLGDAAYEEIEYKAFLNQVASCTEGLGYLGIRQIRVIGCEADDLISVLTAMLIQQGNQVSICSTDKDFHQLASENCLIYSPSHGRITTEQILEMWGVACTEHIPMARAIIGDPSDNIPGINYLGPKRAAEVIRNWNVPLDQLKGAPRKRIELVKGSLRYIVQRNLKLMKLPSKWAETFYTPEQGAEFLEQLKVPVEEDMFAFAKFCKNWELDSVQNQSGGKDG